MEQAKQTFLAFFRREKLLKWVVALGLCGMALIYLSSFWTPEGEEPAPPADAGSSAEYSQSLEQELSRIISAITGEKSPAVLVTLEDSGRSLYAEDGRSTNVLFEDSQGNQQPLTITQTQPQVQGVVVVSAFAEDPATREKLVTAVCTALDLSSAKVCVVSGG